MKNLLIRNAVFCVILILITLNIIYNCGNFVPNLVFQFIIGLLIGYVYNIILIILSNKTLEFKNNKFIIEDKL